MAEDKERLEAIKKQEKLVMAYKNLFKTPDGKTVLEDLEGKHYIHSTTITSLDMRSHEITYNEGQRSAILGIKQKMSTDLKKLKESLEASQT